MKKILGILMIMLLLPVSVDAAKKKKVKDDTFDVYLLIGQSNMAGRGWLFDSDKDVLDGVFILNDRGEIEPASQPLNKYSSVRVRLSRQAYNLGGPFADVLHRSTGRPILLVVNARGATSARMWKRDAPNIEYWPKYDEPEKEGTEMPQLFSEAVRRGRIAMQYGTLKAIIWHQGESDAYEKYAPLWLDKIAEIADDLRMQLGVSEKDVPFIAGEANHNFSRADIINNEIHRISQMVPNSTWVSAQDCNINKDKIHFSRQGLILLGKRYAEKVLQMVYGFSSAAALAACNGYDPAYTLPQEPEKGLYTLCDFDNRAVEFTAEDAVFSVVGNPLKDGGNSSAVVGKLAVNTPGALLECSNTTPIDFTGGKREIRMRVISPKAGVPVSLVLAVQPSKRAEKRLQEQLANVTDVRVKTTTKQAGVWEDLVFDLTGVESNFYQDMSFSFADNGDWYFDNLVIPDDDISALCLFQKAAPPMLADPEKPWMCNSIANPDVQTPEESIDGNWWLWVRGGDGTRAHLGYYTQPADSFNPLGPWNYYEGNPIVPAGWFGEYDSHHAIDPAPVMTDDGRLFLYYKGIDKERKNRVLIAATDDGKNYSKIPVPWKEDCGVADVVKWNGKYYLYVAMRMYEYTNPESGDEAVVTDIFKKGGAPDNCDWYSLNGGKIFRVNGCDKWFIAYQAGVNNPDFPVRFHVAYSDDLLHWTKVQNSQPFFARGARGEWDQGAIWAPAIFEYGDTLYMYYEGWGREGYVPNRDRQYFLPAHSQVGIASCKTADFLSWCGF